MRLLSASRPDSLFATVVTSLLSTGILAGSGLENGEVQANGQFLSGGATLGQEETLSLEVDSPESGQLPPPPNAAPALARINGSMLSVSHLATAGSNSELGQFNSAAQTLVEYVDNIVVNAEGIASGTELILTVAWNVSGQSIFNAPNRIRTRSRLLLDAAGIALDPDPDAPEPPRQAWSRDVSNYEETTDGEFGQIQFDFLVQAGVPSPGNIRMRSAAGVIVGGSGSTFTGNYNCQARGALTAEVVGATNLRTKSGRTLYRWTTNSQSGIDYGSRDDDPPQGPTLTIGPSEVGEEFSALSWASRENHFYLIEAAATNGLWALVTEVPGTGLPLSIDLLNEGRTTGYRIREIFGSQSRDHVVRAPVLQVLKSHSNGLNIRLAWNTHPQEIYQLNEILPDGTESPAFAVSGDGAATWFDFAPETQRRVFQVRAIKN